MGFLILDIWRIEIKFVSFAHPEPPYTQITLFAEWTLLVGCFTWSVEGSSALAGG